MTETVDGGLDDQTKPGVEVTYRYTRRGHNHKPPFTGQSRHPVYRGFVVAHRKRLLQVSPSEAFGFSALIYFL